MKSVFKGEKISVKQRFIFLLIILLAFFLVSCEAGEENENSNRQESTEEEKADEQTKVKFRGIHVDVQAKEVVIRGKVKTNQYEFYYEMEQDGKKIVEETAYSVDNPNEEWESFEIMYDTPKEVKENGELVIINIYGKNIHGDKISSNYITVDFSYL